MQTTVNERIKILIDTYDNKISSRFAKRIGVSPSVVSAYLPENERQGEPGFSVLQKIINAIPEISSEWLIRGEDPMVRESLKNYSKTSDKKEESQSVPLYDFEAAAGLMKLFKNTQNILEYISIPNLPKCDGAIHISGDSMYPLLKSGDIVIYKQIHDIASSILYGNMYLISVMIDEEDYTLVKYIHKSDKGDEFVKLVSQNRYHEDIEVQRDKILALAYIKASIRINSMA